MVDIVKYFEDTVLASNTDNTCGRCWKFTHGRKDYTNLIKRTEDDIDCCTWVLLEEFNQKVSYTNADDDGFSEKNYSDIKFKAFIGVDSDFTRQVYCECNPDDLDASKWKMYLEPLHEAICCLFRDNFCNNIAPAGFRELHLSNPEYNYKDQNLDGFFVSGVIRKYYR